MNLSRLIRNIENATIYGDKEIDITALVYDSRNVETGSLFVCIKGYSFDGHSYIEKAIEEGAKVILMSHLGRVKEESDKEEKQFKTSCFCKPIHKLYGSCAQEWAYS